MRVIRFANLVESCNWVPIFDVIQKVNFIIKIEQCFLYLQMVILYLVLGFLLPPVLSDNLRLEF